MAAEDVLERHRVINLAGAETRLGASPVPAEVAREVARALRMSFDMPGLVAAVEREIAERLEAEAACITHCTAASLTIAAAALLTGDDAAAVSRLPDVGALERSEILLLRAHDVDFGARVSQMLALSGARVRPLGAVNRCRSDEFRSAFGGSLAGVVFVHSPSLPEGEFPSLPEVAHRCREEAVPLVVDAAHSGHPAAFLDAGAELVLVSAQKEFGGPTAGLILGTERRVAACRAQFHGIGRAMKPTKEAVAGVLAAVHRHCEESGEGRSRMRRRVERLRRLLSRTAGIRLLPSRDPARIRFFVDAEELGCTAGALVDALGATDPPIRVRDSQRCAGILEIDPRWASAGAFRLALGRLRELLRHAAGSGGEPEDRPGYRRP